MSQPDRFLRKERVMLPRNSNSSDFSKLLSFLKFKENSPYSHDKGLLSRPRARTRQGPRCGGVLLSVRATMLEGRATTLDLSKNPHGEKTLMHLLRDLTAKWGHRFTI